MEALISALGLLISTLLSFPSYSASITEGRKVTLAKSLVSIVDLLDTIIRRGYNILDRVEALAIIRDDDSFLEIIKNLDDLVKAQINDLMVLSRELEIEYIHDIDFASRGLMKDAKVPKSTNAHKVLSIYEPDLGDNFNRLIATKFPLLVAFARLTQESISRFSNDQLILHDIEYLPPSTIYIPSNIDRIKTSDSEIKMKEINLSNSVERQIYLNSARQRLEELKIGRKKLAELIKEHFEPHHLL